ncbi:MAG: PEP-CTERM sorting domain-containing protein [Acidobacteria bacterium]|nr:PEP-CTERM sorting domain-containing protein [Acidobacteriota bacterium]
MQGGDHGAIPEPASVVLLGTGLAGVVARLRKRRRAKTP